MSSDGAMSVDGAAANGPMTTFVHHIRISTDGEINAAVKSED
jgi:hypothetical protein